MPDAELGRLDRARRPRRRRAWSSAPMPGRAAWTRSTRRAGSRGCARTAARRSPGDAAAGARPRSPRRWPPSSSAWPSARWRWPWSTRATASSSAAPIGAYQGVSHRCAQMLLEVEGARSLTYYAAWAADAEPESLAAGGVDGQGLRVGCRLARAGLVAPGARRDRLHLGARPPLLPQARRRPAGTCSGRRASTASAWPGSPGWRPSRPRLKRRRPARPGAHRCCSRLFAAVAREALPGPWIGPRCSEPWASCSRRRSRARPSGGPGGRRGGGRSGCGSGC